MRFCDNDETEETVWKITVQCYTTHFSNKQMKENFITTISFNAVQIKCTCHFKGGTTRLMDAVGDTNQFKKAHN